MNYIRIAKISIAGLLAFLGVIQASGSAFGAEKSGAIMVVCGASIAALQAVGMAIDAQKDSPS